jgi:FlaA1/EpsC-like NDP-sugar epimerase
MDINWYTVITVIFVLIVASNLWQKAKWTLSPLDFTGKVVFISGGSSGIGEQLAKDFINHGAAKVIIAARRTEELQRVKNECMDPSRVMIF